MVIFQYNLYIFGIHLRTVLYPKQCYNEPCYKEVAMYVLTKNCMLKLMATCIAPEKAFVPIKKNRYCKCPKISNTLFCTILAKMLLFMQLFL